MFNKEECRKCNYYACAIDESKDKCWYHLSDIKYLSDMTKCPKTRAEKRRNARKKTPTYNFTQEQLDKIIQDKIADEIEKAKMEAAEYAINQAMLLLFVLPMEVLMDHYWVKSYAKKIPEFTEHLLEYYQMWQRDELDMDKMKADLKEYGGIEFYEEVLTNE